MSDAQDTSRSVGLVGGNALPGGVMMRTSRRVGVAVRQEATGLIVTEGFDLHPPTGRWIRLPLARGIVAMRTALATGKEAMLIGDRLRWGAPEPSDGTDGDVPDDEPLGWGAKVLMVVGAVIGILVQVLAFRVRADHHRQAGRPHRSGVHRRRRGDSTCAAARDALGDEHAAPIPAHPVVPRGRASGDRGLRGRRAADGRRRRGVHPFSPALRNLVPRWSPRSYRSVCTGSCSGRPETSAMSR